MFGCFIWNNIHINAVSDFKVAGWLAAENKLWDGVTGGIFLYTGV